MTDTTLKLGETPLELPESAPVIRITAGAGSAGQKTWNIRRPVTLIGSRRPAHIVLHDKQVSKCHCAIVNTGTEVLLRDLHTAHGTYCNQNRVDLAVIQDGDVLTVGELKIQVAIRTPEDQNDDSGCGLAYVDPTLFAAPLSVRLDHTEREWRVSQAVVLVGRHQDAEIRVDHPDVASRHAIIFRFADGLAVFDLGSHHGITVSGRRCPMSRLNSGDRIAVGPCVLSVEWRQPANGRGPKPPDVLTPNPSEIAENMQPADADQAESGSLAATGNDGDSGAADHAVSEAAKLPGPQDKPQCPEPFGISIPDTLRNGAGDDDSAKALTKIESELIALQKDMAASWERLNSWESQLRQSASELDQRRTDLSSRQAELDAQDAAMRGQLHDLTRYNEQIMEREKELAEQLARIQQEKDAVTRRQAQLADQEAQIVRHNEELRNREHVLAQRWARMQASICPHCGKAMRQGPAT